MSNHYLTVLREVDINDDGKSMMMKCSWDKILDHYATLWRYQYPSLLLIVRQFKKSDQDTKMV
ncbi:hypothetical protein O9993_16050 [Vibrio lentus]|nr:hypothetical protein [Vibrio lentus]